MPTAEVASAIEEKVVNADNLPTLPVVAIKVLELTQLPDVSASAITSVIQNDPALSAKLLKLANSSMFGMPKKIGSLQQATVMLGLRTVKVMVLSFSVIDCFNGKIGSVFDYERYWRRSLTTAVGAKLLADAASDSRRDEAFVGGLLADIGMMAAWRCAPEEYEPVLRAYLEQSGPVQAVEREHLGITHAGLGAKLLAHWGLPDMLCRAVAAHHGEDFDALEGRTRTSAAVLWSAAMIADLFCGDVDSQDLDTIKERCIELSGIDPVQLEYVLDALDAKVRETASLFAVNIGQTVNYEELQARAMAQLAALSVEATRGEETARAELEQLSDETETLRHRANTDALTGIANRRAFADRFKSAIQHARRRNGTLGLILMDLDRFKSLNDTYGHQVGDDALRMVGACLGKISERPILAARYGGEEFAVIVTGVSTSGVRDLAESIRRSIERRKLEYDGQTIEVTASLGAVHVDFANERVDPREIIERADECLYQAKANGRNRVELAF